MRDLGERAIFETFYLDDAQNISHILDFKITFWPLVELDFEFSSTFS